MPHLLLLLLVGVLLVLLIGKLFAPSLEPEIAKVLEGGELEPLLKCIAQRRPASRPDAYNRAIRRLWDGYKRDRAIPLIRALVENHSEARIAQFWLEQVRTVEPELARASFDEAFMAKYYKAEEAAACARPG